LGGSNVAMGDLLTARSNLAPEERQRAKKGHGPATWGQEKKEVRWPGWRKNLKKEDVFLRLTCRRGLAECASLTGTAHEEKIGRMD